MQIEVQIRTRCNHPKSCRTSHAVLPGAWLCQQCDTAFRADGAISRGDEYRYQWLPLERAQNLVRDARERREERERERED